MQAVKVLSRLAMLFDYYKENTWYEGRNRGPVISQMIKDGVVCWRECGIKTLVAQTASLQEFCTQIADIEKPMSLAEVNSYYARMMSEGKRFARKDDTITSLAQ